MGLFRPHKGATYRRFEYDPRFYDPKKDEEAVRHDRLRRRMRIERKRRSRKKSPMFMLILLILCTAVYFIGRLG